MPELSHAPVIGLGHQSRVGKNEAANAIYLGLAAHGVAVDVTSFAALLKDQAHQLWGHFGLEGGDFYEGLEGQDLRDVPLFGIGKSPVQLWIDYGNAVRGVHGETWLDACLASRRPGRLLVISDVRFDNEGDAIQALGGLCVKIERSGCPVKGSDRMIRPDFPWDAVIQNDGALAELRATAVDVARRYMGLGL